MRRIGISFLVAMVTLTGFAFAELSSTTKDWLDSPAAQLLLTKKERKEFKDLSTDAQAEQFIALFWAKRDPNLDTKVNEFKVEFDQRVAAADKQFTYANERGALTDRGRTLILLGPPTRHSFIPAGDVAKGMQNQGGAPGASSSNWQDNGGMEVWEYDKGHFPSDVKANQIVFIFRETRLNYNDFPLDRGDRRNALAMKVLADAPERFLLHPKLTEVPQLGFIAGSKAATPEQLGVFDGASKPWPDGSEVMTTEGVASAALHPLWVWIELPASTTPATTVVGRVTNAADGTVVGTFARDINGESLATGRGYELALPVEAGDWKVDLALDGADGAPVAVKALDAKTAAVPSEGTFISPLYWSADVRQDAQAKLGDPFNVGGWHVIPNVKHQYTTKDSVSYFAYVLRPGLDAAGKPKFQVKLALFMGDKKLTEAPPQDVQLSQVQGELWMFGHGLPLQVFRQGGEFRLVVTVIDTISGTTRDQEIPLTVAKSES